MSRKPNGPDQRSSKEASFNSLVKQLEDEDSLLNYLPEDTKISVLEVPEDLLNLDEDSLLKKLLKDYHFRPTTTIDALRNNFWMEFDRVSASRTENQMVMQNIYLGVCTRTYWHKIVTTEPHALAYILTRSPEYDAAIAGLLSLSTRRIRDILSIPIKKNRTEYQDPKLIELVLKAAAMVDLRNKGGYLNRSETKNLTVQQNTNKTEVTYTNLFDAASSVGKSAEAIQLDINKKLKELEEDAARMSLPLPKPKFAVAPVSEAIEAEYKEVDQSGEHRPRDQATEA